jgi:hypothetical protein
MKSSTRFLMVATFILAVTLMVVWSAGASRKTPPSGPATNISDLIWLAGDWQSASGGRAQVEEHWTHPAGGTMIGMGRTVVGDKTAEFEFLRIEQRGSDIFYVANPNANCPQTDFKLTRLSRQEVIFENPAHDYPKRIIYRKNSDLSLVASVDAGEGTKAQSFSYLPVRK